MIVCRGLLIRGGDVLEAASHTDTVIFDKTGTLTRGKPAICSITAATTDLSEQDILAYAACVGASDQPSRCSCHCLCI